MSIAAVEDALLAWVKAASGLDDEHVFFANQKVERPSGPYATVRIMAVVPIGAADAVRTNYDATRDPGVEIEQKVIGERAITASVQVYNCPTTGVDAAIDRLTTIQLGISLPSIRAALSEAGVSPFDVGTATDLSSLLGTAFDGRGSLDTRFYVRLTVSEFTTWIQSLQGTAFGVPYSVEAP